MKFVYYFQIFENVKKEVNMPKAKKTTKKKTTKKSAKKTTKKKKK